MVEAQLKDAGIGREQLSSAFVQLPILLLLLLLLLLLILLLLQVVTVQYSVGAKVLLGQTQMPPIQQTGCRQTVHLTPFFASQPISI